MLNGISKQNFKVCLSSLGCEELKLPNQHIVQCTGSNKESFFLFNEDDDTVQQDDEDCAMILHEQFGGHMIKQSWLSGAQKCTALQWGWRWKLCVPYGWCNDIARKARSHDQTELTFRCREVYCTHPTHGKYGLACSTPVWNGVDEDQIEHKDIFKHHFTSVSFGLQPGDLAMKHSAILPCLIQRQKNLVGGLALPTGKFLRVRKVFARYYKINPLNDSHF